MIERSLLGLAGVISTVAVAIGCGSAGPTDQSGCAGGLHFDGAMVPRAAVASVAPVGGFSPPYHVLPTDHGGIYLTTTSVPLVAPAAAQLSTVHRQRYLASSFRQGQTDYSVELSLCGGYVLRLAHLVSVPDWISNQVGQDCQQYTGQETVESCVRYNASGELAAGDPLGVVGGATSGAFDIGLNDSHHTNVFANPARLGTNQSNIQAICPYDPFPADDRAFYLSMIKVGSIAATGEQPQCGTMEVDQAGTAKGIWVLQSNPLNAGPDETVFITLANHPALPVSRQMFSIGPSALVAPVPSRTEQPYPKEVSGQVNRSFAQVLPDGTMYCYVSEPSSSAIHSYFLRLAASGVLTLERKLHSAGQTPCSAAPASWAFSAAAINFIR